MISKALYIIHFGNEEKKYSVNSRYNASLFHIMYLHNTTNFKYPRIYSFYLLYAT